MIANIREETFRSGIRPLIRCYFKKAKLVIHQTFRNKNIHFLTNVSIVKHLLQDGT